MIVTVGLVILVLAVIVGAVGLLGNAGPTHQMAEPFSVFGYHVTGSTGTLFLVGIAVGAVAALGLGVLLAGARRTAERGRDARRQLALSRRESAFINRDPVDVLEYRNPHATGTSGVTTQPHGGVLGRWRRRKATRDRVDHGW